MPPKKKWSLYNKPLRPQKPPATIKRMNQPMMGIWLHAHSEYTLSDGERDLLQQCTHMRLFETTYDGEEGYIEFLSDEEIPNPRYDELMEAYKERYALYKEELAWWKAEKAKVDAKAAEEKREAELKLLAQLKEKYEDAPSR